MSSDSGSSIYENNGPTSRSSSEIRDLQNQESEIIDKEKTKVLFASINASQEDQNREREIAEKEKAQEAAEALFATTNASPRRKWKFCAIQ